VESDPVVTTSHLPRFSAADQHSTEWTEKPQHPKKEKASLENISPALLYRLSSRLGATNPRWMKKVIDKPKKGVRSLLFEETRNSVSLKNVFVCLGNIELLARLHA
jgi:hypothetical protein